MSLDHITASPSRTHVECRPNLGKVHLETSAPERTRVAYLGHHQSNHTRVVYLGHHQPNYVRVAYLDLHQPKMPGALGPTVTSLRRPSRSARPQHAPKFQVSLQSFPADDMTEPSVARQSICDATEQMRCDRASATGRPTYKTLDSGQLTMQQIVENVEHITERETSWLNVRHSRSECRVQAIDIDRDVNTLDTFP
ncbi:hypothetical protein GW17_00051715 [Ensete ventricosum]|nr:hypothetical protein GW17_00051715 [Ensete ventricosum]